MITYCTEHLNVMDRDSKQFLAWSHYSETKTDCFLVTLPDITIRSSSDNWTL